MPTIPIYDFYMACPECGETIMFWRTANPIKVNCESLGGVSVPNMFELIKPCKNPLCGWSKVKVEE